MAKRLATALWPFFVGIFLIGAGAVWNERALSDQKAVAHYNEALAVLEQQHSAEAITLFTESALYAQDPKLKAAALHNAATVLWSAKLGKYQMLVETYKEALRSNPQLKEASFNLELLYYLKASGQLQDGGDGDNGEGSEGGKGVPGGKP